MRAILLSIISIVLCSLAFADKSKEDVPTVPQYKIEKKTVLEAVRELNRLIINEHPHKPELLVAYIPTPYGKKSKDSTISLQLMNNPPITVVIEQLAQLSNARYEAHGSRLVLYDWTRS